MILHCLHEEELKKNANYISALPLSLSFPLAIGVTPDPNPQQ